MTHSLTSSEQAVRELLRRQMHVPFDVLEPLHGVSRSVLQPKSFSHPLVLVSLERFAQIGFLRQTSRQCDGVLHRELGPRADGEVRSVRRITNQDRKSTRLNSSHGYIS